MGLAKSVGVGGTLDLGKATDLGDGPKPQIDDGGEKAAEEQNSGIGIAA